MQEEIARLDERYGLVNQAWEKVVAREAELTERETTWEYERAFNEQEAERLRQEVERLQGRREFTEQQLADLRDEVERLARRMLAEEDDAGLGISQAA